MIDRMIAAAVMVSGASVAQAQPAQAPVPVQAPQVRPAPVAAPALDPARLAAARRFVDEAMPQSMMEQIIAAAVHGAAAEARNDAEAARRDPHHAERIQISERVSIEEANRVLRDIDPNLRALLAEFYGRQLGVAELEEATRFYSSPAGRRFVAGGMAVAMSPEYQRSMESLAPAATAALAGVEERFMAATADMPPLPGAPARPPRPAGANPPAAAVTPPTPAPAPVVAAPSGDPVRVAAARRAVDAVWPQELFREPLDMRPVAETLMAMRVAEFGVPLPPEAGIDPNSTLGEVATRYDPAFVQRVPVLTRFFGAELLRVTTAIEPDWRRVSTEGYAREFTASELDEITRFFLTPAGRAIAVESYRAVEDPQFVRGMVLLLPRIGMQAMAATQRVQAATAHLPMPAPPPEAPPVRRRRGRN